MTPEQIEGIKQSDLERSRLVKLVNEKHEAKRTAKKDIRDKEKRQSNKAEK